MTTQYGFFIDSSRCTGCKTCELACKDFKDLGPEVSFRRIYEYAGGDWQEDNGVWHQNVFAYYLSISCNHCDDPACTKVCPSGAMHKREDGFVVVDEDVCIGCRYCHMDSLIRATSQRTGTRLRLLTGLACGIVMRRSWMLALPAHSSP